MMSIIFFKHPFIKKAKPVDVLSPMLAEAMRRRDEEHSREPEDIEDGDQDDDSQVCKNFSKMVCSSS